MRKKIVIILICILFILSSTSYALTALVNKDYLSLQSATNEQELVLLQGMFTLTLVALNDTNIFNIKYVFPLNYTFQVPILLQVFNSSSADILDYKIENDTDGFNKIVNFTIGDMNKNEHARINFSAWALVKNEKFEDLPSYVDIPNISELPKETKTWLVSTDVVQVNNPFIQFRAKQLRGSSDDLMELVDQITIFTYRHRWVLFNLECLFSVFFAQDAVTTLFLSGECPGKSHLGCALLRANGVPARVIIGIPSNPYDGKSYWYASHSLIEYYCPGYGWVFTEIPKGFVTYEPKNRLVVRISYPWEENTTIHRKGLYRIGLHRWYWINNDNISSIILNRETRERSAMKAINENVIVTDQITANETFSFTRVVYRHYELYQKMDLVGENLMHFQNAVSHQKEAILSLNESDNLESYIGYLEKAYDEYKQIIE